MVEEYSIKESDTRSIQRGHFVNLTLEKHSIEYGSGEAKRILNNATSIFSTSIEITNVNRNLLLVGRVQSGKTANLEMITAIAFDNGYNTIIIYGGYDSVLLDQTTKRFEKAFDVDHESPVKVFSTSENDAIQNIDQDIINYIFENTNGRLIIVSMKRPNALEKINSLLKKIDIKLINPIVVDDEGDQASLNTEFKKNSSSATYKEIVSMKKILKNPLYLSVTATPQALVFSPEFSELRPIHARLIKPGNNYTGADSFHIQEGNIVRVEDETVDLQNNKLPSSLKHALHHYLIASAIMRKRGIKQSDMIIHVDKRTSVHSDLNTNLSNYINSFKMIIETGHHDISLKKVQLSNVFADEKLFNFNMRSQYDFNDLWNDICEIVRKVFVILQNSQGKISMANRDLRPYKIYIGGDLLQRGITFKKLVTTYFTRWPRTAGNMDTTLQRARWFGYRSEYIDLCRIFCTSEIAHHFSKLTEIDNDLWNQFESIENNQLSIADIIIDENDTGLNPSRSSVVSIKTIAFRKKWLSQKTATYNISDLLHNNDRLLEFINKHNFLPMSEGRTDGKPSAWYTIITKIEFVQLLNSFKIIFDLPPFSIIDIARAIENESIAIELFWDPTEKNNYRKRERSFDNDMKVSALQQGADTTDEQTRHYLGDSYVIKDESMVILQVFSILPIINGQKDNTRSQFMYSLHFPTPRKSYQWNKK